MLAARRDKAEVEALERVPQSESKTANFPRSWAGHGYEATTRIEVCERYLEARDAKKLKGAQKKIAVQAEIVIRSCAKVGIIALIDEGTGYDKFKKKTGVSTQITGIYRRRASRVGENVSR
jgi:hypothetical protein